MAFRYGPGPVFVYESITATRRLSLYAFRALFVTALLIGLWGVWSTVESAVVGPMQLRTLATLGSRFYTVLAVLQISTVLIVAPAATAGAVCLDRARGALTHLMVTDLSDAEIVLGKLGARLLPVAALVACTLPVVALGTLLGGIEPRAVAGLALVTAGVAVLGCSLALTLSVRATKSHEVLLQVYAAWFIWLMAYTTWEGLARQFNFMRPPDWFLHLNPFALIENFAPRPGAIGWAEYLVFLAVTLAVSAALLFRAVRGLRVDPAPRAKRTRFLDGLSEVVSRLTGLLPGPRLDGNPVLWREWHRNRPSPAVRRLRLVFFAGTAFFTVVGVVEALSWRPGIVSGPWVTTATNCVAALLGLLLISVTAPTALSEERVRGSLDVLLTTPMSTRAIVWGKWWGAFRPVPWLAALPAFGTVAVAWRAPVVQTFRPWPAGWPLPPPVTTLDRVAGASLPVLQLLTYGALLTSLGVALATWVSRPGRAVGWSVAVYLAIAIGWIIVAEMWVVPPLLRAYQARYWNGQGPYVYPYWVTGGVLTGSPLPGQTEPIQMLYQTMPGARRPLWWIMSGFVLAAAVAAAVVFELTVWTFDRCVGRAKEGTPALPGQARAPARACSAVAAGAGGVLG